jgi:hypothetical protein
MLQIVLQLLAIANVPSSLILFTLMMEATWYSETSVFTRATQHHIPGDDILHTPVKTSNLITSHFIQHPSTSPYHSSFHIHINKNAFIIFIIIIIHLQQFKGITFMQLLLSLI